MSALAHVLCVPSAALAAEPVARMVDLCAGSVWGLEVEGFTRPRPYAGIRHSNRTLPLMYWEKNPRHRTDGNLIWRDGVADAGANVFTDDFDRGDSQSGELEAAEVFPEYSGSERLLSASLVTSSALRLALSGADPCVFGKEKPTA